MKKPERCLSIVVYGCAAFGWILCSVNRSLSLSPHIMLSWSNSRCSGMLSPLAEGRQGGCGGACAGGYHLGHPDRQGICAGEAEGRHWTCCGCQDKSSCRLVCPKHTGSTPALDSPSERHCAARSNRCRCLQSAKEMLGLASEK